MIQWDFAGRAGPGGAAESTPRRGPGRTLALGPRGTYLAAACIMKAETVRINDRLAILLQRLRGIAVQRMKRHHELLHNPVDRRPDGESPFSLQEG